MCSRAGSGESLDSYNWLNLSLGTFLFGALDFLVFIHFFKKLLPSLNLSSKGPFVSALTLSSVFFVMLTSLPFPCDSVNLPIFPCGFVPFGSPDCEEMGILECSCFLSHNSEQVAWKNS